MNVLSDIPLISRLVRSAMRQKRLRQLVGIITHRSMVKQEAQLSDLVADYDVMIMKHCYPASDVLEDVGGTDPSSPRQSLENYRAIYRLLRDMFDENPDTLFILWTLPPRHRLFEPSDGDKDANAARATAFSNWLKGDFLIKGGSQDNVYVWDFRELLMDPDTNFLKYKYELSHSKSDSHPNKVANNDTGPQFAQFIANSINDFANGRSMGEKARIIFLSHSTGRGVYEYSDMGICAWFDLYNTTNRTNHLISRCWYPSGGNMPVDYYRSWLTDRSVA